MMSSCGATHKGRQVGKGNWREKREGVSYGVSIHSSILTIRDRVRHQVGTAEGLGILETNPIAENQALGMVDRERTQNDLIDKRVKGGRRSNSQREGKHCRRRKRRAPEKRSCRRAKPFCTRSIFLQRKAVRSVLAVKGFTSARAAPLTGGR